MMFYQNFSAVSEKVLVPKIVYMIETKQKIRGVFAAVMTGLSEAFDCISHELLIAKLNAYGFDETSLQLHLISENSEESYVNYKSRLIIC